MVLPFRVLGVLPTCSEGAFGPSGQWTAGQPTGSEPGRASG